MIFLSTVILASAPMLAVGQQVASFEGSPAVPALGHSLSVSPAKSVDTAPGWQPKFERWVDLKGFDFGMRYKSVTDSNGGHEFNNGQQRSIIDGKFKFDEKGKYAIAFHGSSGRSFNWGFADFIGGGNKQAIEIATAAAPPDTAGTIIGVSKFADPGPVLASYNSGGWAFYVRRLYLDVEPIEGVEAQYGSLDINRGAASEITTYDNDGYISGERLLIKRPKQLFFDEASATFAYLGDLNNPNFFTRGQRLAHSNYHQFLLRKHVGKRVDASFDYTWQNKANTLHEAAFVNIHESRVLDTVRVEFYQRLNTATLWTSFPLTLAGGNGHAFTVAKTLTGRFSIGGGYDSVDILSVILAQSDISTILGLGVNGDQYGIGKRIFVRPTVKLTPYLEGSCFYTKGLTTNLASPAMIWNQEAFNIGFNFDMKKALFPKSNVN